MSKKGVLFKSLIILSIFILSASTTLAISKEYSLIDVLTGKVSFIDWITGRVISGSACSSIATANYTYKPDQVVACSITGGITGPNAASLCASTWHLCNPAELATQNVITFSLLPRIIDTYYNGRLYLAGDIVLGCNSISVSPNGSQWNIQGGGGTSRCGVSNIDWMSPSLKVSGSLCCPGPYPEPCTPTWQCTDFSECSQSGTRTRTCTDINSCGTTYGKPIEQQACTPICNDECPLEGDTRCSGTIQQACSNYDSDSCLEWPLSTTGTGNTPCQYSCTNGQCSTQPPPSSRAIGQPCTQDLDCISSDQNYCAVPGICCQRGNLWCIAQNTCIPLAQYSTENCALPDLLISSYPVWDSQNKRINFTIVRRFSQLRNNNININVKAYSTLEPTIPIHEGSQSVTITSDITLVTYIIPLAAIIGESSIVVKITVDPTNAVQENNEENNILTKEVILCEVDILDALGNCPVPPPISPPPIEPSGTLPREQSQTPAEPSSAPNTGDIFGYDSGSDFGSGYGAGEPFGAGLGVDSGIGAPQTPQSTGGALPQAQDTPSLTDDSFFPESQPQQGARASQATASPQTLARVSKFVTDGILSRQEGETILKAISCNSCGNGILNNCDELECLLIEEKLEYENREEFLGCTFRKRVLGGVCASIV